LKRYGTPRQLEDLDHHRCLPFLLPSSGRILPWLFKQGAENKEWSASRDICVSEDALAPIALAKRGVGLCQVLKIVVEAELKAGDLVEVLQDFSGRTRQFSLLYPQNRHLSAAVRACVDAILASE
jgi:DNA-binding transcriptional LysR family regulator